VTAVTRAKGAGVLEPVVRWDRQRANTEVRPPQEACLGERGVQSLLGR
jgi:hypothetical protein